MFKAGFEQGFAQVVVSWMQPPEYLLETIVTRLKLKNNARQCQALKD